MKARRLLVLLAVLALASVTVTAAPKKLLVVTQSKGFQHGPVKRPMPDQPCLVEQQLKELGEKSGVFTADFSQDAIAVLTKENLAKYDAVFFYTTGTLLPAGEPLVADAGARRDARAAGPSPERSRIEELLAVPSIGREDGGERLN